MTKLITHKEFYCKPLEVTFQRRIMKLQPIQILHLALNQYLHVIITENNCQDIVNLTKLFITKQSI